MAIYFASSDETGDYKPNPGKKFLKSNPHYCRATLITEADEWKKLHNSLKDVYAAYGVGPEIPEVKWSHIWSINKYRKQGKEVPSKKPYAPLADRLKDTQLKLFPGSVLSLLRGIHAKVVITVWENRKNKPTWLSPPQQSWPEEMFLQWHLQEHMQRIEMEIQEGENLAVLFVDHISNEKDKMLRNAYNRIYQQDAFIKEYSHIKDSFNIEYSHHSSCIQLADFIAGCFAGMLRGYGESSELFRDYAMPYLRRSDGGEIMGYGVRDVPRCESLRQDIKAKLKALGESAVIESF
jgi:hypothetical protein